jgi:hypothetical protein
MMEEISEIKNHKFLPINENEFTQGNEYVVKKFKHTNSFIEIPKQKPIKNYSLFDQIIYIMEGHHLTEKLTYKNKLINSLCPEILKPICKKHKFLKKEIVEFMEDDKFFIPSCKDVIIFFATLIKSKIIIINDNYFIEYLPIDNEYELIHVINQNEVRRFEMNEMALMHLTEKNLKQLKEIKNMKLPELKEYAKYLNIDSFQNKTTLIDSVNKYFKKE